VDKGAHARAGAAVSASNGHLPPHVERLLIDHISSVAELEALMLLRRRAPEELGAEAVGRELRIDPVWAGAALHELARCGLLDEQARSAPVYRFAPRTPALDEAVAALVQIYAERPVQVMNLIFEKPNPNVIGFAESFRLRKS
jgi:hypothetical protein